MSNECAYELAAAIVKEAARDYQRALVREAKFPGSVVNNRMIADCERFFRSRWFGLLSDLDPEMLIDRLRKEATNGL